MARQYQKRGRSHVAAAQAAIARHDAAERRNAELARRYIGAQLDLFGAPPLELYRRKPSVPKHWERQLRAYHRAELVADIGLPPAPALAAWDARAWLERAFWLASWDRWRASSKVYERFDRHARELTVERVRRLSAAELEPILERLVATRADLCRFLGRRVVWTRAELGELIVEARNRLALLAIGREQPRQKAERFDLARMPLEALERLIQRHPNLELVDAMRAERSKRIAA